MVNECHFQNDRYAHTSRGWFRVLCVNLSIPTKRTFGENCTTWKPVCSSHDRYCSVNITIEQCNGLHCGKDLKSVSLYTQRGTSHREQDLIFSYICDFFLEVLVFNYCRINVNSIIIMTVIVNFTKRMCLTSSEWGHGDGKANMK